MQYMYTSPSMSSVSSLMRTPMALRNACEVGRTLAQVQVRRHALAARQTWVKASVLDISSEKISEAAIMANGVSSPRAFAMPIAIAVLPVPGCPANRMARPAILPSLIMDRMIPAACTVAGVTWNMRQQHERATHLSGPRLPNHALRHGPSFQRIVQTKASDV
jgi:hypothetical protein